VTARRIDWLDVTERGTAAGVWFLVVLSTVLGRAPARAFLRALVPYYMVFHGQARRSSRDYLEQVHGHVTNRMVHDHLLRFAQCTLDRLLFVRGRVEPFDVRSHGEEHLRALLEARRGAILLGAHLGSFEAMQRMADARDMPINVVGFFRNARMLAAVLKRLNPRSTARLVELDTESVDFVLTIRERIQKGELVAILADRTVPGGRDAVVRFFGRPARLPTGPYLLASVLDCPVYLTFGLHSGRDRYDLYCEPFAERIVLSRRGRQAELAALAQRYADALERYCRLAPDNWFNFYDFWESSDDVGGAAVESAPLPGEGNRP